MTGVVADLYPVHDTIMTKVSKASAIIERKKNTHTHTHTHTHTQIQYFSLFKINPYCC